MKFYIETFGCKVNSYESNYLKELFVKNNYDYTNDYHMADIVIVNTCTVTNTADNKCRKYIRRIRRDNPSSILIVTGCAVQNNIEAYQKLNIDILVGNNYKTKILSLLEEYLKNKKPLTMHTKNRDLAFENMEINDFDHTRAFIKIEDGCDNFCTYCIIPFTRGKCRSKDFDEIITEVKNLVNNNHLEIVLTGIHTGSYNYEGHTLVDVINEISKIDGLKRIRLSSVEVTELDDKFMEMLKNNPKFCNHLHIPLQAGSDNTLKRMMRKYDLKYFEEKIKAIREIRPDISISTDVIVGFPLESDEDFLSTYEFCQKIKFSKIHVFPYSRRDGTVASRLKEVDEKAKTERVHKLLRLSEFLENEYESKFKGQVVDVLVEEINDNVSIGHTSNYLKVEINAKLEKNKIYEILYK